MLGVRKVLKDVLVVEITKSDIKKALECFGYVEDKEAIEGVFNMVSDIEGITGNPEPKITSLCAEAIVDLAHKEYFI